MSTSSGARRSAPSTTSSIGSSTSSTGRFAGQYSQDLLAQVGREHALYVPDYAEDHGMTSRAYLSAVNAHLKSLVKGARVYVRISNQAMEGVASSGRLKSMHDEGHTADYTSTGQRTQWEQQLFGRAGAIYGYVAHDPQQNASEMRVYGDVIVQMKPSSPAAKSATMTFGDSLYAAPRAAVGGWRAREAAALPDPISRPTHRSVDFSQGDPLAYRSLADVSPYPEAQLHSAPSLSDFASIRFTFQPPSDAIQVALRAANFHPSRDGVTWTYRAPRKKK